MHPPLSSHMAAARDPPHLVQKVEALQDMMRRDINSSCQIGDRLYLVDGSPVFDKNMCVPASFAERATR